MGINVLVAYSATSGVIGAVAGFVAQRIGYDISAYEGMRQAVIAGLPVSALFGSILSDDKFKLNYGLFRESPYLSFISGVIGAGLMAGSFALGGIGMEDLSKMDISQGFTSVVGGLEGIFFGMFGFRKE